MPQIKEWKLETFPYGDFTAQKISFSIDHNEYIMVFSSISAIYGDGEAFEDKQAAFGMSFPAGTFEIKFDRLENFEDEEGILFQPPTERENMLSHQQLVRLGNAITKILDYHMSTTSAHLYIAIAENPKLKSFYDRLAKKHAQPLNCAVLKDIGEEGLGYAIRTPHFQS